MGNLGLTVEQDFEKATQKIKARGEQRKDCIFGGGMGLTVGEWGEGGREKEEGTGEKGEGKEGKTRDGSVEEHQSSVTMAMLLQTSTLHE